MAVYKLTITIKIPFYSRFSHCKQLGRQSMRGKRAAQLHRGKINRKYLLHLKFMVRQIIGDRLSVHGSNFNLLPDTSLHFKTYILIRQTRKLLTQHLIKVVFICC